MDEGKPGRGWALIAPALVLFITGVIGLWRLRSPFPNVRSSAKSQGPETLQVDPELSVNRSGWEKKFREAGGGAEREQVLLRASKKGVGDTAFFLSAIAGSDDRLSSQAANALGQMSNPAARPALRELTKSTNVLVAANAIRALGNIGSAEDAAFLRKIQGFHRGTRLWHEAARALGKIGHAEALGPLLEEARDEQERLTVLSTLKDAARPESVPILELFLARGDLSAPEWAFADQALQACRR